MMERRKSLARFAFAAGLTAIVLAGCNKAPQQAAANDGEPAVAPPIAALPLATATPPAPAAAAPVAAALPAPAKPIRIAARSSDDRYYYIDGAYSMDSAFGDTPPDYTVDYDGTRPWVWRSDSGAYRVVERLPEGERYYYYQPGAAEPFYVTDPAGSYAYANGELVGAYGPNGVPLDYVVAQQRADAAARYLYRARQLYQAAQHDQRQAAYAAEWQQRRDAIFAQRQDWQAARARDAQWQAWHDAHVQQERQDWQGERDHRLAYAAAIGAGAVAGGAILAHDRNRDRQDDVRFRQQQDVQRQQAIARAQEQADGQRRQMAFDHQRDVQLAQARQQAHDNDVDRQRAMADAQHDRRVAAIDAAHIQAANRQHQADMMANARADAAHRQAMADQHHQQVADAQHAQADRAREQAQAQHQQAFAQRQQQMQEHRMQAQAEHQQAAHQAQQQAQAQRQQAVAHQQAAHAAAAQSHAAPAPHQPNGPHREERH